MVDSSTLAWLTLTMHFNKVRVDLRLCSLEKTLKEKVDGELEESKDREWRREGVYGSKHHFICIRKRYLKNYVAPLNIFGQFKYL